MVSCGTALPLMGSRASDAVSVTLYPPLPVQRRWVGLALRPAPSEGNVEDIAGGGVVGHGSGSLLHAAPASGRAMASNDNSFTANLDARLLPMRPSKRGFTRSGQIS
jgi:hypothetical protein